MLYAFYVYILQNLCIDLIASSFRFADSIDLNTVDPVVHKHIPYVVILVKMAEEWVAKHGSFPSTRQEKNKFKVSSLFASILPLCEPW